MKRSGTLHVAKHSNAWLVLAKQEIQNGLVQPRHPERERRTWAEGRHENEATGQLGEQPITAVIPSVERGIWAVASSPIGEEEATTHIPRSTLGMTIFLIVIALLPATTFACPTCYGDPNSSMAKGAANGVWFMIAVIAFVQIGFIALFFSFWRRAKAMRRLRDQFRVLEGGAR